DLHPEGERLEAPPDEERFERTEGRPEHLVHEPDPVEQTSLRRDDGSRDYVAVTPEVFRRAVQHAVDPELDRPLVDRGGEGVVGERRGAHGLGRRHGLREVRDHHRRIRRGLNIDQTGVGTDRLFPRAASPRIYERRFDPEPRKQPREDLGHEGAGLSPTRTVDRAGPWAPAPSHGGGTAGATEIRFEFSRSATEGPRVSGETTK